LIKYGADVQYKKGHDRTCLMILCYNRITENFSELVSLFVENGLDINAQDWLKFTALHDLVRYCKRAKTFAEKMLAKNAIATLLGYGADPMIKDYKGQTVFDCAKDAQDEVAIKALQDNDPEMRPFEMQTFVTPVVKRKKSNNVARYIRDREIGMRKRAHT